LRRVAAEAGPQNADIQYELGRRCARVGFDRGDCALEKALRINPEPREGYYGLAWPEATERGEAEAGSPLGVRQMICAAPEGSLAAIEAAASWTKFLLRREIC
jgi:hypothetical protein